MSTPEQVVETVRYILVFDERLKKHRIGVGYRGFMDADIRQTGRVATVTHWRDSRQCHVTIRGYFESRLASKDPNVAYRDESVFREIVDADRWTLSYTDYFKHVVNGLLRGVTFGLFGHVNCGEMQGTVDRMKESQRNKLRYQARFMTEHVQELLGAITDRWQHFDATENRWVGALMAVPDESPTAQSLGAEALAIQYHRLASRFPNEIPATVSFVDRESSGWKEAMIEAVVQVGEHAAVPLLDDLGAGTAPREITYRVLGDLQLQRAVEPLKQRRAIAGDRERRQIDDALVRIQNRFPVGVPDRIADLIDGALADGSNARHAALTALAASEKDGARAIRYAIFRYPPPDSGSARRRISAAFEALATMGVYAQPFLLSALENVGLNTFYRSEAAEALGTMGEPAGDALIAIAERSEAVGRTLAVAALVRLGPSGIARIAASVVGNANPSPVEFVDALSRDGSDVAIEALVEVVLDKTRSEEARVQGMGALRNVSRTSSLSLEALIDVVLDEDDPVELRRRTVFPLSRYPIDDVYPAVAQVLSNLDDDAFLRSDIIAFVIPDTFYEPALELLRQTATWRWDDTNVRSKAVDLLARWNVESGNAIASALRGDPFAPADVRSAAGHK